MTSAEKICLEDLAARTCPQCNGEDEVRVLHGYHGYFSHDCICLRCVRGYEERTGTRPDIAWAPPAPGGKRGSGPVRAPACTEFRIERTYADPGFIEGKPRHPIDTKQWAKQCWDSMNTAAAQHRYTRNQLKIVLTRIKDALDVFGVQVDLPPSLRPHTARENVEDILRQETETLFNPNGFFVYVLLAVDARPIYVGQSGNLMGRLGDHMRNKDRRYLVDRIQTLRCMSREHMCDLESSLIKLYQPPLNVAGR